MAGSYEGTLEMYRGAQIHKSIPGSTPSYMNYTYGIDENGCEYA